MRDEEFLLADFSEASTGFLSCPGLQAPNLPLDAYSGMYGTSPLGSITEWQNNTLE